MKFLAALPLVDLSLVPEEAGDKLFYGLKITLIGMGAVFLVLILLMIVLYVFKLVFYTIPNRKKAETAAPVSEATVTPAAVQTPDEDDSEIVAAITAALAVYCEQGGIKGKYRIKSFKRL